MGLFQSMAIDVIGRVAASSSNHANDSCQVGFADTGRTEKNDVFGVLYKAHGRRFINLLFVDGGLKSKIKSQRAAERVMTSCKTYLETNLKLKSRSLRNGFGS